MGSITSPVLRQERPWVELRLRRASPSTRKQRVLIDLEGEAPAEPFLDAALIASQTIVARNDTQTRNQPCSFAAACRSRRW